MEAPSKLMIVASEIIINSERQRLFENSDLQYSSDLSNVYKSHSKKYENTSTFVKVFYSYQLSEIWKKFTELFDDLLDIRFMISADNLNSRVSSERYFPILMFYSLTKYYIGEEICIRNVKRFVARIKDFLVYVMNTLYFATHNRRHHKCL